MIDSYRLVVESCSQSLDVDVDSVLVTGLVGVGIICMPTARLIDAGEQPWLSWRHSAPISSGELYDRVIS